MDILRYFFGLDLGDILGDTCQVNIIDISGRTVHTYAYDDICELLDKILANDESEKPDESKDKSCECKQKSKPDNDSPKDPDKVDQSVLDFSVRTLEVGGLGPALNALRLPFGKESRSDHSFSSYKYNAFGDGVTHIFKSSVNPDKKDLDLIGTLIKRGDEHAKVLRGIVVWCEINAPRYWWQEMDTYSVGACRLSSESTMHIQGRALPENELVSMKANLKEGTMQKRIWMLSYQTLRRIYFQRRNHRLPQWRMFCQWIERLPFAKELIIAE